MTSLSRLFHRHGLAAIEGQASFDERVRGQEVELDLEAWELCLGEERLGLGLLAREVGDPPVWRWAWVDPPAGAEGLEMAEAVRRRAVEVECEELLAGEVPAAVASPEALSCLAQALAGAAGAWRQVEGGAARWYLVRDPEARRDPPSAARLAWLLERACEAFGLEDPRRALLDYLRARGIDHRAEPEHVHVLTVSGETLEVRFPKGGKGQPLTEVRPDPPAEGFGVEELSFEGDETRVHVRLGALAVGPLGRLVRCRTLGGRPFSLKGPKGRVLEVRSAASPGYSLADKHLVLFLDRGTAEDVLAALRPRCKELAFEGLAGVSLEVVASEVKDEDGVLLRTIGWDPLPDPDWAIDPAELAAARAKAGRGRAAARRRRWAFAVLLLVASPFLLLLFASLALRHVPYTIPQAYRPPAPGVGAALGTGLRLRYLGVSGYEVTDGTTTILLDPVVTRPTVIDLVTGPVDADPSLHGPFRHADYILVNHAHHDHSLDAPAIALRTGATVVGSQSVLNLCRSRGVPPDRLILTRPGQAMTLGTFRVDARRATHSPILGISDPMSGLIPPDAGELWFFQYTNDGGHAYRLQAGGTSLVWHVSSHFEPGSLLGFDAEHLIFGFAGEPMTAGKALGVLREVNPRRVLPTHYDNFFQPLSKGMGLLPTVDPVEGIAHLRAADPDIEVWLLDHGQTVELD